MKLSQQQLNALEEVTTAFNNLSKIIDITLIIGVSADLEKIRETFTDQIIHNWTSDRALNFKVYKETPEERRAALAEIEREVT